MKRLLTALARRVLLSLLWVSKNFWKRFLGIETPLYRLWWNGYSASLQKRLDRLHNQHALTHGKI